MSGYWAHLPGDLLIDIAKRLKSVEDMAAFAMVCSSWNAVSSIAKLEWAPALPWLMLPENTEEQPSSKWTLLNPGTKKLYKMELPETLGCTAWGGVDGWICTLDRDSEFQLFNPLTKARLPLPPAHTLPVISDCVKDYSSPSDWFDDCCGITNVTMVKTPINNELIVFVMYNQMFLGFARPGDSEWVALECFDTEPDDDEGTVYVESVVDFNGQIMVLYGDGKLDCLGKSDGFLTDEVDFAAEGYVLCKEDVDAIADVWVYGDFFESVSRYSDGRLVNFTLVESFGELLLVLQFLKDIGPRKRFKGLLSSKYMVFKFNPKFKDWIILEDLGDVSLFMGVRSGFAVCASDTECCKPNCIYFMEVDGCTWKRAKKCSLGIYNMRNGQMEELSVGDHPRSDMWPPFWFMPKTSAV